MYLKEVEVNGFKSFADKLNIVLDNEITCIVGPNGSGKSNIVDAVRWVLGEQSAKNLRGQSGMVDVIFSGSKSRAPLNVASVVLTFDNSDKYLDLDYEEISVKRRIFRSGESEYYINNNKCRLKDITDLFLDSGLGKESFNIISQGEIQNILSNSVNDRRLIFEEAAGVLKYKKRKEEATRKLERTDNNLIRIFDILEELKARVAPLKRQSKKAQKYLENKTKLEEIEVALVVKEIETLNTQYQISKNKIKQLEDEILSLNNDENVVKEESIKIELLKLEEQIRLEQEQLLSLTAKTEQLKASVNLFKERSKYQQQDINQEVVSKLNEEKLNLETSVAKDSLELNNNEKNLIKLNQDLIDINMNLNQLKDTRLDLNNKLQITNNKLNSLTYEIEQVTNLIENDAYIPSSVKRILNNPRLEGINDIVSNVITTKEKFEIALNVASLSFNNFVIIDENQQTKEAINYLKDNNLGRVTFLPINVIKPRYVDHSILSIIERESGYIGILSNLLQYDKKYENIILNLLGNVIIVDTLDSANSLAKKINHRYKIITLTGEVINPSGSITGGSLNRNKSLITEKRKRESLQQEIVSTYNYVKELEKDIKDISVEINLNQEQYNVHNSNIYLEQEAIKHQAKRLNEEKEKLNDLNLELKALSSDKDLIKTEEDKILEQYYSALKQKEEVEVTLNNNNHKKDELNSKLDHLEANNKLNNQKLREKESLLKDLEISISSADIKLDNYLQTLSEDYEMTYEYAKTKYYLEADLEESRELVSLYKNNLKQIGMVNLEAIDEYEEVNQRYEFLEKQQTDLYNAKNSLVEIINELDQVMEKEFAKTFKEVEKEFAKVFKELFGGGEATLKLIDPNNILTTGIDIVASPPGKKLTNISLLSGGEKTLTAISLLFAILNIRKVPFCLFDEVEAALDDVNVDNFGKYLENYKEKTQFLLITHKKKTMEYANTLYGITMQESGVSKLVSVKLN